MKRSSQSQYFQYSKLKTWNIVTKSPTTNYTHDFHVDKLDSILLISLSVIIYWNNYKYEYIQFY